MKVGTARSFDGSPRSTRSWVILAIGSLKEMHGLDESSKVQLQSMMQKSELESSFCVVAVIFRSVCGCV